jgi:hypothetical protein
MSFYHNYLKINDSIGQLTTPEIKKIEKSMYMTVKNEFRLFVGKCKKFFDYFS